MAKQSPKKQSDAAGNQAATSVADTQNVRRVKYGTNVIIAVAAAILIVIALNWISFRSLNQGAMRWDLTSTRQYSLSPLTESVINKIDEPFRIVTLLDPSDDKREDTQQAIDLIDEYDLASSNITVEHINPATDITRREEFERHIFERFSPRLKKLEDALIELRTELNQAKQQLESQANDLSVMRRDPGLKREATKQQLNEAYRFIEERADAIGKALNETADYKETTLPNYGSSMERLANELSYLDRQFYPGILKEFISPPLEDVAAPAGVRDSLMGIQAKIKKFTLDRLPFYRKLSEVEPVIEYGIITSKLSQHNPIIIMNDSTVHVISVNELYQSGGAKPSQSQRANEDAAKGHKDRQFLGEERLTGSLARMTLSQLKTPPKIIFVSIGTNNLAKVGAYKQVEKRLKDMKFDVVSWDQRDTTNARGGQRQVSTSQAMPEVKKGQKAVWIILPGDPIDAKNPASLNVPDSTLALVRDRVDKHGDGVMLLVPPEYDPKAADERLLKEWGLVVDHTRVLLRSVLDNYGDKTATNDHVVRSWPKDSMISKALDDAKMRGWFRWASAIEFRPGRRENIEYWPIAQLKDDDIWGNFNTKEEPKEGKGKKIDFDPNIDRRGQEDTFTIGYAALRKQGEIESRMVVVADHYWASDMFGVREVRDPTTNRTKSVNPYPGNHELFVNSVYWLAGLDELIAASARTQDIRRIQDISDGDVSRLRNTLLFGLPFGVFVIGLSVWFTRRG